MEETDIEYNPNLSPRLFEIFIKSKYVINMDSSNTKCDTIIPDALKNTEADESYINKFNHYALTFHFLTPKERDLHCSHENILRKNLTHTYYYYKFIQNHYTINAPSRNPQHKFTFINSKYTLPYFLNFYL